MNLAAALEQALRDRYSTTVGTRLPMTHRTGLTTRMRALERAYGGKGRAADAAGIPRSTWGFWTAGQRKDPRTGKVRRAVPGQANAARLEHAYRRLLRLDAADAELRRRRTPTQAHISAVVVGDPGGRRYINNKSDGPPGGRREQGWRVFRGQGLDLRPMVEAWRLGRDPLPHLTQAVRRSYGQEFGFEGDQVAVRLHD